MAGAVSRNISSLFSIPRSSFSYSSTLRYQPRASPRLCQCISTQQLVPKIAEVSLWKSIIPKFWRNQDKKVRTSRSNPAYFYIAAFILIGSQSIHLLQLRSSHETHMRTTDAKIRQLREVIQKLKNGEELDVRKALGTGNRASEDEWEEVLREIEAEEMSWKAKVEAMQQKRNTQKNSDDISNNNPPAENQSTSPRPPRFY